MEKPSPTLWRVLDTDYLSTFSATSIGTVWGILVLFKIFRWTFRDETFYLLFAAGVSVLALGVILWRFLHIRHLFEVGQEVRARVVSASFYRDRGRVVVEYGQKKEKTRAVSHLHTNRRTRKLQPGDWVTLLYDPKRPRSTVIREAYLDM